MSNNKIEFNNKKNYYPYILLPLNTIEYIENKIKVEDVKEDIGFKKLEKNYLIEIDDSFNYKTILEGNETIFDLFDLDNEKKYNKNYNLLKNHLKIDNIKIPKYPNIDDYLNKNKLILKPKNLFEKYFATILLHLFWFLGNTICITFFVFLIGFIIFVTIGSLIIEKKYCNTENFNYFCLYTSLFSSIVYNLYFSLHDVKISFKEKKSNPNNFKIINKKEFYKIKKELHEEYIKQINFIKVQYENQFNVKLEEQNIQFKNNYNKFEFDYYNKINKEKNKRLISIINTKKGYSELLFLEKLLIYFGDNILTDCAPNIGKSPFMPDFVLFIKELNFYIDIEIDEPYDYISGKTIHHNRSNDNIRDNFFIDINWGVIRFCEEQIILYPDMCCKIIKEVINSIKNKQKFIYTDLNLIKFWTHEQALIMMKNKTRENYIQNLK